MAQATHAAFDTRREIDAAPAWSPSKESAGLFDLRVSIHGDLASVEREWRAFERGADCTVFQSFDWMSAWHRHVGTRRGTTPAVVMVRDGANRLVAIWPLAIERGSVRRLTWLASELCDYNAPLLAPDFSRMVDDARFLELWGDITRRLRSHPGYRYDLIQLDKMPAQVGAQRNPMLGFPVVLNPSNAYATELGDNWEQFYTAKRSSATRRRDRTKRNKLGQYGAVTFVTPSRPDDVMASFETLMQQKTRQFARMGVPNLFVNPGYPEFYRDVAARRPDMVHISRLDVGTAQAAVNYGLVFKNRYYHVLASYTDHEMAKFGPGAAHLHELMSYAMSRGCKVFDFTIGDERYKRDWCESDLKLYDYVSMATARGAIVAGPLLALRAVKRWIKQTPAVWNAVMRVRAALGSLRGKSESAPSD